MSNSTMRRAWSVALLNEAVTSRGLKPIRKQDFSNKEKKRYENIVATQRRIQEEQLAKQ